MKKRANKSVSIFKNLKYYLRRHKLSFAIIATLTTIGSIITVINPKIIGWLLKSDDFSGKNIGIFCGIILSLIVFLGFTFYVRRSMSNSLARQIEVDYRNRVLKHLLNLDLKFYEKRQSGEIITKVINDTNVMADNAKQIPILFISSFVTFIGSIIVMSFIEWKLTLAIVSIVVTILLFSIIAFKILRKWYSKTRKVYTKINSQVVDKLGVIKLIKANSTEKYESKNFNQAHQEYLKVGKQTDQREGLTIGIFMTLISSINVIAILIGFIFINLNIIPKAQIGTIFLPFILSVNTLVFPIFQTIDILGRLATVSVSIERLEKILGQKNSIETARKPIKISQINGDIIFKDVNFGYDENLLILKNFNFTFQQNRSYAIVGATGVGKTTISKLLLRFYDPLSGQILINNLDLKSLDLRTYLNKIGYIEQEPEIFHGTFMENIKYGSFEANENEVISAAKQAKLHDFIDELPNKYQTIVGERGFILSGGQKQRILIARMILKNPQLLILDEATSALDNIVEREIQAQLSRLISNRTSIIIAHRLSTIKNVDFIIVLEKNRGVSQVGTFKELIAQPGHFKNLYEAGLMFENN